MSDETVQEPGGKRNESAASDFEDDETAIADRSDWGSFLRRQVPYISVLGLAIVGVAYTNMAHQPLVGYWEFWHLRRALSASSQSGQSLTVGRPAFD
jgi:hypothetical protein